MKERRASYRGGESDVGEQAGAFLEELNARWLAKWYEWRLGRGNVLCWRYAGTGGLIV